MKGVNSEEAFARKNVVGNYLNIYFGQEQGVRLGESCVVSLKVHKVVEGKKGQVKILTNQDAGQVYLDYIDPGQVVHLDVFHEPGMVDPKEVAKRIFWNIEKHLVEEEPKLNSMEDEKFKLAIDYALRIEVLTTGGRGLVYDLFQGEVGQLSEEDVGMNRVRVLMKLTPDRYGIILPVAEAVEDAILDGGLKLAKVKRIVHTKEKPKQDKFSGYLIFPWKKLKDSSYQTLRENQNQLILKLAERFGSLEELQEFLEGYSSNLFKRKSVQEQKRKWGDLEQHVEELEELGILKKGILGPVLTRDGQELKEFLLEHRCELEAELRRSIRRMPRGASRYRSVGDSKQKLAAVEYTNRNKVVRIKDNSWSGDLAVPETVVQAKKSSLMRHESRLTIKKEDLHVYQKRSYVPVNVCLLIDASASMAGEKRQAACFLAEHLLLSGKEKVAVVTFQEMKAQVVVPFTRNQKVLSRGLRGIRPGGLTPLADGIVTAVDLIKTSRVENPVLVLITDGVPNFPLWSFDAKKDALEAAQRIADARIKFICIGVESNKDYLKDLVDVAKGKLYVVDDLNRGNLIEIVRYEKKKAAII